MDVSRGMEVESIRADEDCSGPVIFVVRGRCGHCRAELAFRRTATLLMPQEVPCRACGGSSAYRFRPEWLEPHRARLGECRRVEELVLRRMSGALDGPVRQLGRGLLFPIFAHLSNGFR